MNNITFVEFIRTKVHGTSHSWRYLTAESKKIGSGNDLCHSSPLYSPIINFIRQIARTATMDHCILRPLYPLFSPCQWSLTAPRTISDVEDEDEEESGENRRRARSCSGSTKRESEGIIQELPRDHPKEACHGSPPSSPRLASVVTRRE